MPQCILALGPDGQLPPSKTEELVEAELRPEATRKLREAFPPLGAQGEETADVLLARLAQLLAPTAEAAVQTGGVKGSGKVVYWPAKEGKKLDTGVMLNRIRVSYTALRAAKVDGALRGLLLAELITQLYNEGGTLLIPQGLRLQTVANDKYSEYKSALSGLTESNVANVASKLVEMGLNPDAGAIVRQPDLDVRMAGPSDAVKRLKHDVAAILGPEKGE